MLRRRRERPSAIAAAVAAAAEPSARPASSVAAAAIASAVAAAVAASLDPALGAAPPSGQSGVPGDTRGALRRERVGRAVLECGASPGV